MATKKLMAPKPSHNLYLDGLFSAWSFSSEAMQLCDSSSPSLIMKVEEVEVLDQGEYRLREVKSEKAQAYLNNERFIPKKELPLCKKIL